MNTCIKNHFVARIDLKAPAKLFISFHHANPVSFPGEYIGADQSAHATTDDQYVKSFHLNRDG